MGDTPIRDSYASEVSEVMTRTRDRTSSDVLKRIQTLEEHTNVLMLKDQEKSKRISELEERVEQLSFNKTAEENRPVDNLSEKSRRPNERHESTRPAFETPLKDFEVSSNQGSSAFSEEASGAIKLSRKTSPISLTFISILNSIRDHLGNEDESLQYLPQLDALNFVERIVRGCLVGLVGFSDLPSLKSKEFVETTEIMRSKINSAGRIDISPLGVASFKLNSASSRYFRWISESFMAAKRVTEVFPFPYNLIVKHTSQGIVKGSNTSYEWDIDFEGLRRALDDERNASVVNVESLMQTDYMYLRLEGFASEETTFILGLREDGRRSEIKSGVVKKQEHRISNSRVGQCEVDHREERTSLLSSIGFNGSLSNSQRINKETSIELIGRKPKAQKNSDVRQWIMKTTKQRQETPVASQSETNEKPAERRKRPIPPSLLKYSQTSADL